MVTDVEIVVTLGVALIVTYIIGSYWKHRKLTGYAHWFEECFRARAKVRFHSFGHAGLSVKCEMTDRSDGFRELYFTLSLGARENLMYYPLAPLTHDFDRINCWGILEKPVGSNMWLVKKEDKKRIEQAESLANLPRLNLIELNELGYAVFASNRDYATRFISRATIPAKLREISGIEMIELDSLSSLIRVVSRLKQDGLHDLTAFVMAMGRAI